MEYKDLFKKKLEEYGVSSPSQIPEDKKDDFFLELDKMWNSADEKGSDGPTNASCNKGEIMKKLVEALNKKEIFHSVTAAGAVEIRKQPAKMDKSGKDILKKFFGLEDFTVPKALKDPFDNKSSKLIKKMHKEALQQAKGK